MEVEVCGGECPQDASTVALIERLCRVAAGAAGVQEGHVAVEFVEVERIAALNAEHRGKGQPTDVLSFPIDGAPARGDARRRGVPHELGDVVICPAHTHDLGEAVVHGVLHLIGMDHETDDGQMLALQAEILRWERIDPQPAGEPPAPAESR